MGEETQETTGTEAVEQAEAAFDMNMLDCIPKANAGTVMDVLHPVKGTKTGIQITLAGMDSDRYRDFKRNRQNKQLREKGPGALTAEDIEENGLDALAELTLGWNRMPVDSVNLPFTAANVKAVYRRFPWLKEQVDVFVATRANFMNG